MARDTVKCKECGSMRFEEEVILDRTTYEYICRDFTRCSKSKEFAKTREATRKKYRKKVGLSK